MKNLFLSVFIILLMGCKVKKDIQLVQTKSHSITHSDSSYIDTISGQITINRAYVVDFDSTGRPMSAKINEVVKGSYNELKKGNLIKDSEVKNELKILDEKIEKESGTVNFSLILFAVVVIVGLVVFYNLK